MHSKSSESLLERVKGNSLKGVIGVREMWGNKWNIPFFIKLVRNYSTFYDKVYVPEGTFTQL